MLILTAVLNRGMYHAPKGQEKPAFPGPESTGKEHKNRQKKQVGIILRPSDKQTHSVYRVTFPN